VWVVNPALGVLVLIVPPVAENTLTVADAEEDAAEVPLALVAVTV
jgi:hypothetical protein